MALAVQLSCGSMTTNWMPSSFIQRRQMRFSWPLYMYEVLLGSTDQKMTCSVCLSASCRSSDCSQ